MMLSPDLLDRRALALLKLVDTFGAPLAGPIAVEGEGVRSATKSEGRVAILALAGFDDYAAAFAAPPAKPKVRSQTLTLDLTPAGRTVLPRRVTLTLPRDADPAKRADASSVFQPLMVEFAAAPGVRPRGNACILRVSVTRAGDGAMVENALVRARSDDGSFTAWGLTDAAGEAALAFPALPITFAGAGGATAADTGCAVIVHADPTSVRFSDPAGLAAARAAAAARREDHADPDAIAAANPANFVGAPTARLATGDQPTLAIVWTAP